MAEQGGNVRPSREVIKPEAAAASTIPIGLLGVPNIVAVPRSVMLTARELNQPSRVKDFISLTKPEVLFLVVVATGVGCVMASKSLNLLTLMQALIGTALVAGGTAALNHYIERASDALMRRTAGRPLPSGRLNPTEVLTFGLGVSLAGIVFLALTLNLLTALIGLASLFSYLLLYTPLKRRSRLCTFVGAFPGAAPVLMGWTAVRGDLGAGAWVLFAILFLWQFPHFLAIGWMYRDDYSRAGLQMIPDAQDSPDVKENGGRMTFSLIRLTAQALVVVSLIPTLMGMTSAVYLCSALLLGLGLLCVVSLATSERSGVAAKHLLHATVIYLPLLFLFLVLCRNGVVAGWPL
jgi:protoheme IX farnesyltransferase